MYTHPLFLPDLPIDHHLVSITTSSSYALKHDTVFLSDFQAALNHQVFTWQEKMLQDALHQRDILIQQAKPDTDVSNVHELPFHTWIQDATPIAALTAATKRLLWHQRLGHPSDQYLYTAHKFIDGVPNFKHHDPVLDKCPVCIRSKQPKTPGCGNTMKATHPMQGYSINLAFTGQISKDSDRRVDYLGLHGERAWILIKDHFSWYLFGTSLKSKGSPLNWLCNHLSFYNPGVGTNCGRYVHMDQGGELYKNPRVQIFFEQQSFQNLSYWSRC